MNDFWSRLSALADSTSIVIDRPRGSRHPRFPGLIYPFDYGYLKNTSAMDGNEIDVFRGSLAEERLVGIACTVDTLKRDTEVKLLIGCTEDEIASIERFYNQNEYMSGIIIRHPDNL